jgi:hypothetical protein
MTSRTGNGEVEHGMVTQRPPSYTQFKYPKWITEPDCIKVRLPRGDQFTCDLMNNVSNTERNLKWIQVYDLVLGKKNLWAPLDVSTTEAKKLHKEMKKFLKVSNKETPENKVTLELEVAATQVKLAKASAVHGIAIGA